MLELDVVRPPKAESQLARDPARRVLVISDNSQIGLWVVRSLGSAGLTAFCLCHAADELAAHSRYAAGSWLIDVTPADPGYADAVLGHARSLSAGSVMTIAEASHVALSGARDRFEPDVHVFSPPPDRLARTVDKAHMRDLCRRLGIPVARGTTLQTLMRAPTSERLRFPVILRTRDQVVNHGTSRAPWKVAYAEDETRLRKMYDRLRDIAWNILVEEYHPGDEEHVHVLMKGGEPFMVCAYIGEHHMPLAGGVTIRRITCDHEGPRRDAARLLRELGWEGVATVQFHYDRKSGRYIFLELNPRFCAGMATVIRAGFDSPFLQWQSHFEPEKMRATPTVIGLRTRLLGADANWLLSMIGGGTLPPDQRRLGRWEAIASFLFGFGWSTSDDVFTWRDPKPFALDLAKMLRKVASRARG